MGRWGDGEMGRWGDGEMGRWGDGEMGRGDGLTCIFFHTTTCIFIIKFSSVQLSGLVAGSRERSRGDALLASHDIRSPLLYRKLEC